MTDITSVPPRASRLRRALLRRYPGVAVEVTFVDHTNDGQGGTYQGWHLKFESPNPQLLVDYGLAGTASGFGSHGDAEFDGVRWHSHGVIDASRAYGIGVHIQEESSLDRRDRALSKKMQAQVAKILKPFMKVRETGVADIDAYD